MAIYKLSPAADQDLIDIYIRGVNKWEEQKADSYQRRLISAFYTVGAQ